MPMDPQMSFRGFRYRGDKNPHVWALHSIQMRQHK